MPKHAKPDQAENDVTTVHIEIDGVKVKVDVCAQHFAPIKSAYEAGTRITAQAGDLPANTRAAMERRFRQG